MKRIFIITVYFLPTVLFSQVKGELTYIHVKDTSYVPFMYLVGDTLDYADGGSQRTELKVSSVMFESSQNKYIIQGSLSESLTGESYGNWGIVVLGKIKLVSAETWLGFEKTGVIIKESEVVRTKKGKFKISVPHDYDNSVIFTGEGGSTVIEIPFKDLLSKYYINK